MKLIVLGSGTCVPRVERASPGFFLEIGKMKILLDCGPGILRQLSKAGKDYKEIDLLILSHFHPDHISDLPAFFQALNYTPGFKRKKKLQILASESFTKFFTNLQEIFPGLIPQTASYKIEILEPGRQAFPNFLIETKKGNHSPDSIMIKIITKKKSLVYTGDTDFDEEITKFAYQADLLISECSYPEGQYVIGHLTPNLVGKMAKEAEVKKLLLTHFYPSSDRLDIKKQVKKYFQGKIILAKDLQEYSF